jgi:hypothetical protein
MDEDLVRGTGMSTTLVPRSDEEVVGGEPWIGQDGDEGNSFMEFVRW